jgi:hypothetical protein
VIATAADPRFEVSRVEVSIEMHDAQVDAHAGDRT